MTIREAIKAGERFVFFTTAQAIFSGYAAAVIAGKAPSAIGSFGGAAA